MAPPKKKVKLAAPAHEKDTATKNTSNNGGTSGTKIEKDGSGKASKSQGQKVQEVRFTVDADRKPIQCIRKGSVSAQPSLIFTHGAGGDCTAAGMVNFMTGFARSSTIVCFDGAMNLKSRSQAFATVKEQYPDTFALGGRSLGSRAAVVTAESGHAKALVLVSYPLVSPTGDVRDQILLDTSPDIDVLFISGDHDNMCDVAHLEKVRAKMKARSWLVVVKDGDHGMNVKPKSATTVVGEATGEIAARWLQDAERDHTKQYRMILQSTKDRAVIGEWSNSLSDADAASGKHITKIDDFWKKKPTESSQPEALTASRKSKRKKSG